MSRDMSMPSIKAMMLGATLLPVCTVGVQNEHAADVNNETQSAALASCGAGLQTADRNLDGHRPADLSFYISNHDQSPSHHVIHPIVGKTNFVYDAHGALEKVKGEAIAILVKDSENVTIRNLRLDGARPCLTEARIEGFKDGETIVSVDRALYPIVIRDGRLWMCGPGWTNETRVCKLFDGVTREQTAEAGDIAFDGAARELPDGRLALRHDFTRHGVGAKAGDVIAFRPRRRDVPAIVVYNSRNTLLEDVVVHDAKGMALIAQRAENVTWRGTRTAAAKTSGVFPRPGAYASAHADASHFSNVKGQVTVENCWFEGMMDDAINVHSTCLAITNVVASNRNRCRYMHEQAIGFEVFCPGETLPLLNGRTLETGPELKVVAVERHDAREITVTLAEPLPPGWGAGDAVENADYQCAATFRGNVVCNNRARGTLFTTPKPVVVESNLFSKVTGSPILFAGDDYYWYESGACRDVVIRGNVFSNCCTAAAKHGYSKGVISFYPIVRDFAAQRRRYHGNVLVEGNAFNGFDVPLLFAISTENITWRDNRVTYGGRYRGWEEPPFVFKHCLNVTIDGRAVPGDTLLVTAPRHEEDFNDGWQFRKEPDAAWRSVTLPHDWAIEGTFDPAGEPGAGRLPYAGVGRYRKTFILPPDAVGQCVFLDVGGAMMLSDVWLNGVHVGDRKYGFSSYRVNLTNAIRPPGEPNAIEIRCEVPAQSARFYHGAGLYRPLRLVRTAPVHVGWEGVFVTTTLAADGSAQVKADVPVRGPLAWVNAGGRNTFRWGDVRILNRVLGEDGMTIRRPVLWSPETPHLYTLETTLTYAGTPVDAVRTRFGVRTLRFDPHQGFFLNGRRRKFKGVCLNHDLGALGAAFSRGAFERQVKIMKEMGADSIRTSHNPPAPEALEVCDEMGMMVMDEAFDCWERHKYPADYAAHFPEWHARDMADLVLRDRSHPSVVMWSIGNEIPESLKVPRATRAIEIGAELTAIAHRLDPTRPTTMGHCRTYAMTNGMAEVTDVFGANYLQDHYAWYMANKAGRDGRGGLVSTETCSAVSTRGENDLATFRRHNCLPQREFAAQAENPANFGEFVWTGFDYLGEPDPHTQEGARSSYYGIVDLCGFPKERYWTYRAHWNPADPGDPRAERLSASGQVARYAQEHERFRDLVFVKVSARDAEGALVETANDRLAFRADGPWTIVGVCNGDPKDYDSLKGDSIRLFHGLAQVILRLRAADTADCTLAIVRRCAK